MNSLEIDFLYVNSGEKSGDAIAFRYGNFAYPWTQKVVVIDGGTLESGGNLVSMIRDTYGTTTVDLVICTHPDADHASGLREVLRNLTVRKLWIHKPWEHSEEILHLFHDGRITSDSLDARIRDEYNFAHELVEIAEEKGIPIEEPFEGLTFDNGIVRVLGPSRSFYQTLIPNFTKTPKAKEEALIEKAYSAIKEAVNWIRETMHIETLDETGVTSAENMSSAVTLLSLEAKRYLFTGDVGMDGLKNVIAHARAMGIDLKNLTLMQAPHHGSKRNISPSILDEIRTTYAYISASKDSDKHPSRKVTNAYKRRNTEVFTTNGAGLCHHSNGMLRQGWSAAVPVPFYDQVEE